MSRTVQVDLEQGTPEWHDWRDTKCGASEAAIIMGCAPSYWECRTWDDLRLVKGGARFEPSPQARRAWDYGEKMEKVARDHFFPKYAPACFERGPYAASLDGMYSIGSPVHEVHWVEIKCPVSKMKSTLLRGLLQEDAQIPPHYWYQLVHQKMVLGPLAGDAYFCVFVSRVPGEYWVGEVPAADLNDDIALLQEQWERFLGGAEQHDRGVAWETAAERWLAAKARADDAYDEMSDHREQLIRMAEGEDIEANGVRVKHTTRRGSVDWKAVAEDLYDRLVRSSIDCAPLKEHSEDFRKKDSHSVTVAASTK